MLHTLAISSDEIGAMAVGGGIGIVVISILSSTIRRMSETRQREQSRREIAAYIAEGSMSPEEGERLMNAGRKKKA